MVRPSFDTVRKFWTDLLDERGLPTTVNWVFHEDTCRLPIRRGTWRFMFKPRQAAEAEKVARFAYANTKQGMPLALVAYAVLNGTTITGLQGDLHTAGDDVYREDWNVYFDTKHHLLPECELAADDHAWKRSLRNQPQYLSELDYLVSIKALARDYGYVA